MSLGVRKFQRTRENFVCSKCGAKVKGTGYTNHCPKCLWSRHVDNNPGDRAAACGGNMEPVGAEKYRETYKIIHKCEKCGKVIKNKTADGDNTGLLCSLAAK